MKRLIKMCEFYSSGNEFTENNNPIIVYKNPTYKEIEDVKRYSFGQAIRGVIINTSEWYVWDASIIHNYINKKIDNPVDINGLRFCYCDNKFYIDLDFNYTLKEAKNLIVKYKPIYDQISDVNNCTFEIEFDKFEEFKEDYKYTFNDLLGEIENEKIN